MYITRSPMRITFIGGGTDYKSFFEIHDGATISSTINKYVNVITNGQPLFVEDKYKFTYRQTEGAKHVEDLKHPVVRETMKILEWKNPLNIATMADLPGNSGLGSSSAFTAALLYNLTGCLGKKLSSVELAKKAIYIERDLLKEPGGYQDQIATTHGGLRLISYKKDDFEVTQNYLDKDLVKYCKERLLLIRVPTPRLDMDAALKNEKYVQQNPSNQELTKLVTKTNQLWSQFVSSSVMAEKFQVIQEAIQSSWRTKSKWGNHIINTEVSEIIFKLESVGARHYKLVGSGGGGFILIAEEPEVISTISKSFKLEDLVYFELSTSRTESLYYD